MGIWEYKCLTDASTIGFELPIPSDSISRYASIEGIMTAVSFYGRFGWEMVNVVSNGGAFFCFMRHYKLPEEKLV